jgi:hypothetical protein
MSRHQNAGQNYNIKVTNKPPENVAKFIDLGTRVTNQNCIDLHEYFFYLPVFYIKI